MGVYSYMRARADTPPPPPYARGIPRQLDQSFSDFTHIFYFADTWLLCPEADFDIVRPVRSTVPET